MKRILASVLAVVFIFTAVTFALPASAADDTLQFSLTNASGVQDGEFTIDLVIKNNPGLWAFYLVLYYDSNTFILRDTKVSDSFAAVGKINDSPDNFDIFSSNNPTFKRIAQTFPAYGVPTEDVYTKVIFFESNELSDFTTEGVAVTLTFQVQGIAKDGEYEIGMIPDADNVINSKPDDVPYTWVNSLVNVGTGSQTPSEQAPVKAPDMTVAPIDTDSKAPDTSVPVETFKGDDGKIYYENEQGETVEYVPDDNPADSGSNGSAGEENTAPDIEGEKSEELKKEESKNRTLLYIIIAAVIVLIAAAVVLFIFIFKTKKKTDSIGKDENDNN